MRIKLGIVAQETLRSECLRIAIDLGVMGEAPKMVRYVLQYVKLSVRVKLNVPDVWQD